MKSKFSQPAGAAQIAVEPASWRDLSEVRGLEKICFPLDAWPILDIIGVLTLPGVIRLKVRVDGKIAGFVAVDVRAREKLAWIATIGVLPEYRRQGLATALLEACEARLRVARIKLSVRASNAAAQSLYQRLGYREVGRWYRYYNDREDAIVMEKTLGDT